jgi:hypothetical protein
MDAGARPFLTAQWRQLVVFSFVVEPELLRPYRPKGVEIDSFFGRVYASLVAFRFERTRVLGWPIPFHQTFPEVNLRFYVRRRVGRKWRRGVVFVREIVGRRAVALVARWFYNERYVVLPVAHRAEVLDSAEGGKRRIEYRWRTGERVHVAWGETCGVPHLPEAGTLERYLTENYWGFGMSRRGEGREFRVAHPPWRIWTGCPATLDWDPSRLYPPPLAEALCVPPANVFVADGSAVTVFRQTSLAGDSGELGGGADGFEEIEGASRRVGTLAAVPAQSDQKSPGVGEFG